MNLIICYVCVNGYIVKYNGYRLYIFIFCVFWINEFDFVIIFVSFINSRVFVYVVGRIIDIGKVVSVFWIFCNKVYIGVR